MIKHIKDLTPDPRNARAHTPRNVGMIEAALGEVGAARSIVIDEDGVVLAGNATIEAAAQAGIERVQVVESDGNTIIAVRRSGLTPEQKTRLALFDNRAAELADWDAGVLASLAEETDLSQLLRADELAALLAQETVDIGGAGDEFDATPEDGPTRTQAGDLWIIGDKHRLLVGDCTDAANVERLMGGERAVAVVTDPPYGMDLDTDWSDAVGSLKSIGRQHQTKGKTYDRVIGDDEQFDPSHIFEFFGYCREIFLWGADYYAEYIPERNEGSWLVWDKRKETQSEAIGSEFELCWSKQKHKRRMLRHDWFGFLSSSNPTEARNRVHPTQKPTSLIEDIIKQWVDGGIVVDLYLGSGTTLVAAHRLGRVCYGCELSPAYADVILRRAEAAGLSCVRHE